MRKYLVLLSIISTMIVSLNVYAFWDKDTDTESTFELVEPIIEEPQNGNNSNRRFKGSGSTAGTDPYNNPDNTLEVMKDNWDSILASGVEVTGIDTDEAFDMFSRYVKRDAGIGELLEERAFDALKEEVASFFTELADGFVDGLSDLLDGLSELFEGFGVLNGAYEKLPSGLTVYKPNIYLYSDKDISFTLEFVQSDLLIVSDPEYITSWSVELTDNQLIVNGMDDYRFLFYESSCDIGWLRQDAGFIINSENRAEQFKEILMDYGFNDTEITDFVEYWDEKLEEKNYIMYPQQTEIVDRLMPVEISGIDFNNYARIWFAFAEYNGEIVEKPSIESVSHEGTALVEWGGVIIQ